MSNRNSANLNSRRTSTGSGGGTKPVQNESSILEVIILVILSLLKRLIFLNVRYRLQTYFTLLFFLSLIVDFGPKLTTGNSYFSSRQNFLNVYFAKLAWFWNLIVLVPFVTLTSMLIANKYKFCWKNPIIRSHLSRLAIATCFWYTMTSLFIYFDHLYGKCSIEQGQQSKQQCRQLTGTWISLDISGHAFIFIYGSLVLIEEARAFLGWDHIQIELLNEQYNRRSKSHSQSIHSNPLRKLNEHDFAAFDYHYRTYRIPVRILFVLIVCVQFLWDFMLLTTILYHHRMIEKLLGGLIAVFCWYISYKVWFPSGISSPNLPGSDILSFQQQKPVF